MIQDQLINTLRHAIEQKNGPLDSTAFHSEHWAQSIATLPAGELPFLKDHFLREASDHCSITPAACAALIAAANRLEKNPLQRALIWHGWRIMYELQQSLNRWPQLDPILGDDVNLFFTLLLLAGIPSVRKIHENLGVSSTITADTLRDLSLYLERYHAKNGRYGIAPIYATSWLTNHVRGKIFRIGRLQFMSGKLNASWTALRHRQTKALVVLITAGKEIRSDGQLQSAGGHTDQRGAWTTTWFEDATKIQAHAIDPRTGTVQRKPLDFQLDHWQRVLGEGDKILDIHIPEDGAMTFESCGHSFTQAIACFKKYFPNVEHRALFCNTWFADPQLEEYMRPDSNIVRFLREGYLLPVASDGWAGFRAVFDLEIEYGFSGTLDFSKLPQQTTLQRALINHINSGKHWRKVGWLIPVDDLNWGQQVYRHSGASFPTIFA